MRCPSTERLQTILKLSATQAKKIREIAKAASSESELRALIERAHPKTAAYVRSMRSDPYDGGMWQTTVALDAINNVMEGNGVADFGAEGSWRHSEGPPREYISMGDMYLTTLIYTRATDSLSIGNPGKLVEFNGWPRPKRSPALRKPRVARPAATPPKPRRRWVRF